MVMPMRGLPTSVLSVLLSALLSSRLSSASGAVKVISPESTLLIRGLAALIGMHMPMPSTVLPE